MVCMQLYVKDNESTPGASAAASIFSRYMNVQGFESLKLGESKVYLRSSILLFYLIILFLYPDIISKHFILCRILFGNYVHGGT